MPQPYPPIGLMKVTGHWVRTPRSKTMTGSFLQAASTAGVSAAVVFGETMSRSQLPLETKASMSGNLLVVLALGVGHGEGLDVVLEDVDLRLHVGPADDAPWIEEAGVGEADPVRAGLLVLRRVDLLAAEMLLPGFVGRALRGHREQVLGGLELLRIVEVLRERGAGEAGQGGTRYG